MYADHLSHWATGDLKSLPWGLSLSFCFSRFLFNAAYFSHSYRLTFNSLSYQPHHCHICSFYQALLILSECSINILLTAPVKFVKNKLCLIQQTCDSQELPLYTHGWWSSEFAHDTDEVFHVKTSRRCNPHITDFIQTREIQLTACTNQYI